MKNELEKIIDPLHLEDLNNPDHPSIYIESSRYVLLIVRFPTFVKDTLLLQTYGFVQVEDDWYFYERETSSFKKMYEGYHGLHQKLDRLIDEQLILINDFREKVTTVEETLYDEGANTEFLSDWFALKRSMVRVHRVLVRTIYVYESFYDAHKSYFEIHETRFDDLLEHLNRSGRYLDHDIEKLNTTYNFYSAQNNDKMNRSIYVLTILSAIFLPLNLLVGFFGMNTGELPFSEGAGTWYVATIMSVITLVMVIFIWMKRGKQ